MRARLQNNAALLGVVAVYILLYCLYHTLYPKYPTETDIVNYSAALVQEEHPELYHSDPIFYDGHFTQTIWVSSYLYMKLFQTIHSASHENMSFTLAALQLIAGVTAIFTFYGLFSVFCRDKWLVIMMSAGCSLMLVLRFPPIPSLFYFACIPFFLRLLWQHIFEPSLYDKPVVLWRAALIGGLIGASPFLVNSVNGLAFNLLTLSLITVQWLAGRMRFKVYGTLLMSILPILGFMTLVGTGGTGTIKDSTVALHLIERMSADSLWGSLGINFSRIIVFRPDRSWLYYLPITTLVTGLSLFLRIRPHSSRTIKLLFLVTSWLLWVWIFGIMGVLSLIYFGRRIWQGTATRLDYTLITALNLGVFIGPILMWIFLILWNLIHWHTLAYLLLQMFRFHFQTFFVISVIILFINQQVTERLPTPFIRRMLQVCLIALMVVCGDSMYNMYMAISFTSVTWLGLVIVLMILSSRLRPVQLIEQKSMPRHWGKLALGMVGLLSFSLILGAGLILLIWGNMEIPQNLPAMMQSALAFQSEKDLRRVHYLEMTDWIRANTPQDSLFYVSYTHEDRDHFFRYLTRRSLFSTYMDTYVGQFNPEDASRNWQITLGFENTPVMFISRLAALYNIDYMVLREGQPRPLPAWYEGVWYLPNLVYENPSYHIYEVEHVSFASLAGQLLELLLRSYPYR